MEGPLPGDQGRRITVLHYGQAQQCSFCLETAETGCLGFGQGKRCESNGGKRMKMSTYMAKLKEETGYMSLKEQYDQEMARVYGSMDNGKTMTSPEEIDKFINENYDALADEINEDTAEEIVNRNPIQKRNDMIENLEKELAEAKAAAKEAEKSKGRYNKRKSKSRVRKE